MCLSDSATAKDPTCVRAITLDNLLPLMYTDQAVLKLNIGCEAIDVFDERTGSKFFDGVNVKVVELEWMCFREDRTRFFTQQLTDFPTFFARREYDAFGEHLVIQLKGNWTTWPDVVSFIKNPYMTFSKD